MALFDMFKKKNCDLCGGEIGLLGNRKLEDGNCCKNCANKLSRWFDDRRHSTVANIRDQLAYREANAAALQNFRATKVIGEENKVYIDENSRRFFVARYDNYQEENPDIIGFDQILSCQLDIDESKQEIMREVTDKDGNRKKVSYSPRRYLYRYNFDMIIKVRNPYFDDMKFRLNDTTLELESGGTSVGGLLSYAVGTIDPTRDMGYRNYKAMGEEIVQILTAAPAANPASLTPEALIEQIRNAPDLATVTRLQQTVTMLIMNDPNKENLISQISSAIADARVRIETQMAMAAFAAPAAQSAGVEPILKMIEQIKSAPDLGMVFNLQSEIAHQATNLPEMEWMRIKSLTEAAVEDAKQRIIARETGSAPVQEAPKPKFCPNCGAPYEGGKFCQSCGSKLG